MLHFLRLAGSTVMVPAAVAREIRQRGPSDLTVQALEQTAWLEVVVPSLIQAWDLGPGEASVLACAYAKTGAVAVLDDLAGRRCAEALKMAADNEQRTTTHEQRTTNHLPRL